MIVIPPVNIDAQRLAAHSIAEPDPTAGEVLWSPGVQYTQGQQVARLETHRIYECIVPGVHAGAPEAHPDRWLELRVTNRWAALHYLTNQASSSPGAIELTIEPRQRIDSIYLRGLVADRAIITMQAGGQVVRSITRQLRQRQVRNWREYFFAPHQLTPTVLVQDLPPYYGARITVRLERGGGNPVRLEALVVGAKTWLGEARWGARNDALNFSQIDRDAWGNVRLQPVRNVPTVQLELRTPKAHVNTVRRVRDELNARPAVWSGLDDATSDGYFESLVIFGIYRKIALDPANAVDATTHMELEDM